MASSICVNFHANCCFCSIAETHSKCCSCSSSLTSISPILVLQAHNIWGPFLVVAPASTLHNWQQEVTRFVPTFKVRRSFSCRYGSAVVTISCAKQYMHNHQPQPPCTTTIHNHHAQPPCTTTMHNHYPQSPCTTTIHNHHAQPPCTITMHNHYAQPPCTITMHNSLLWDKSVSLNMKVIICLKVN